MKSTKKKLILSVIMSMMMVLAMMPSMAFAQSVAAGYDVSVTGEHNVFTGTNPQLTAEITQPDGTTAHVDWSSSNTSVAKISSHKGKITPVGTGTATVTATLREGEAPTGTGTGTGGNCSTAVLATATFDITVIQSTGYGFQGTGGNTLKMLEPSNITGGILEGGGYRNQINDKVTLSGSSCDFKFTMSAGINNFQPAKFKSQSMPHIKILDEEFNAVEGTVVELKGGNGAFDSQTNGITITVKGLADGGTYILEFGADVCANNASKKLGGPVQFSFTTE